MCVMQYEYLIWSCEIIWITIMYWLISGKLIYFIMYTVRIDVSFVSQINHFESWILNLESCGEFNGWVVNLMDAWWAFINKWSVNCCLRDYFIMTNVSSIYLHQNFTWCGNVVIALVSKFSMKRFDTMGLTVIHWKGCSVLKGMEHVPNIFISFDKYLFLEVINILI